MLSPCLTNTDPPLHPTTEGVRSYHGAPPSRGGEISNHEQLAHYLTVWVFCFSSRCWEISGALWCWALSIGTLERSARWLTAVTPLHSGIHWNSERSILSCPTRLAQHVAKEDPAACVGETCVTFQSGAAPHQHALHSVLKVMQGGLKNVAYITLLWFRSSLREHLIFNEYYDIFGHSWELQE